MTTVTVGSSRCPSIRSVDSILRSLVSRGGFSLLEATISIVVSLLILHMAFRALGTERRMFLAIESRGAFLETLRVTRAVVGREVRGGGSVAPVPDSGGDSLAVRGYRGWAQLCPVPSRPGEVVVSRVGLRAPNPDKDSVLIPTLGGVAVVPLLRVVSETVGCGSMGVPERWTLGLSAVPDSGIARYFERGSLHIVNEALRYRRGAGGRQPLTPAVLHAGGSGLGTDASGAVHLRLGMRAVEDTALMMVWEWSTWPKVRR